MRYGWILWLVMSWMPGHCAEPAVTSGHPAAHESVAIRLIGVRAVEMAALCEALGGQVLALFPPRIPGGVSSDGLMSTANNSPSATHD
jgi:hypothetical protein